MKQYPTEKRKLVILEGVDRSGKSTAWEEINKQTKYSHYVMDRGPIGFLAYDFIYDKGEELVEKHGEDIKKLAKMEDVVVLYFIASPEELERRVRETGHEPVDYDLNLRLYAAALQFADDTTDLDIIVLDTTETHVKDHIKELIKKDIL